MKKIFFLFLTFIILTACSTDKKQIKKSIYKEALNKTNAIRNNIDKQNQVDENIIK